jgi:hypothetical protein
MEGATCTRNLETKDAGTRSALERADPGGPLRAAPDRRRRAGGRDRRGELGAPPTEVFAGGPHGRALRVDLAAAARRRTPPAERVILHVEVELRYRSRQAERFFLYNRLLAQREALPVSTLVLYLRGGPAGLRHEEHVETAFGREVCQFGYLGFGISRLPAEDYLDRPEPLAWALAALMQPRSRDPRALRRACLARIARAPGLSDERRFRLFECVANYLELDGGAEEELEALLAAQDGKEAKEMARTLRQALLEEGLEQGIERGIETGRARGMREVLARQLSRRFGPLPEAVTVRLEQIQSTEELARLAERVLQARSLAELGLA